MPATPESDAEVLFRPPSDALRWLPEGPRQLADGRLGWVAIQHGATAERGSLCFLDMATGENEEHPLPGRPGFFVPAENARVFLVGLERRLVRYDTAAGTLAETGLAVDEDPRTLINDGESFERGVVFGTKDPAFRDAVAGLWLWRYGDDGLVRLRDGQTCSNGKIVRSAGSGCGDYLWDIDSPAKRIVRYAFDAAAGTLAEAVVVADLSRFDAFPDGMVAHPDGRSAVVAFFDPGDPGAGVARRIDLETGEVLHAWRTPGSPRVTCPAFVELAGETRLVLTTAAEGMDASRRARHPEAGSLFVTPPGAPPA